MESIDITFKQRVELLVNDLKNGTSHSVDFLKSNEVSKTLSVKGIKIRKIFSPFLRAIYKSQSEYKLVVDHREKLEKTKVGKIYILNHRQSDDIVLGVNAIKDSGYVLFGNDNLAFETVNGLGLWAHGMIRLDRQDEFSRMSIPDKMKFVLQNGGNVIVYAEGYWNLVDDGKSDEKHLADGHKSENWLMQDINIGALKVAQELGAQVVPTLLHYDEVGEKRCYTRREGAITISKTDDIFEKKQEVLDVMNSSLYKMMDKYSYYKRKFLEKDGVTLKEQWDKLVKELIAACDIKQIGYELDMANEKLIGKAKVVKPVTTFEDTHEFLYKLKINKNNEFLFDQNLVR